MIFTMGAIDLDRKTTWRYWAVLLLKSLSLLLLCVLLLLGALVAWLHFAEGAFYGFPTGHSTPWGLLC